MVRSRAAGSVAVRPDPSSSGLSRNRSGSQSSAGSSPPGGWARLASTMRRAVSCSSSASTSQPVTFDSSCAHSANGSVNTPRRNLHRISESMTAARSSVSIAARIGAATDAVQPALEVGLVGAGPIVVGSPGVDRQTQGHGLHGAWLVAGHLHALDVRGERGRALADHLSGPAGRRRAARRGRCGNRSRPAPAAGPRVTESQPWRVE